MQVKKEEVRKAILMAATEEFLSKGFLGTSMREIARKAGCSLSNLYNYFDNKDDLFEAILAPTTAAIEDVFSMLESGMPSSRTVLHHLEFREARLSRVLEFVDAHRDYLRLLLLFAEGSSMRDYKDKLIERYSKVCMSDARHVLGCEEVPVSEFFCRNVCSFYVNTVAEMLREDVPRARMDEYGGELLRYSYFGFIALLNPDMVRSTARPSVAQLNA